MTGNEKQTDQKLVMLTAFFAVLLHVPLLGIFNLPVLWRGIPVLFLYVLTAWTGVIIATAWVIGRRE